MNKPKEKESLVLPREYQPDEQKNRRYQKEHEQIFHKVNDTEHNGHYLFFKRFYKTAALICCLTLILILLMFFGRVGGLTLIYAAISVKQNGVKLPLEKITVG